MAKHVQLKDSKTGEPIYPITIGSDVAPITDEEIKAICDFDDVTGGNVIPVATSAALGCVKVGNGIDIDEDGVITTSGVQMELLWENTSPTSEFPAQTIEMDLSEYDFILVQLTLLNTSARYRTELCVVGETFYAGIVTGSGVSGQYITNRYRIVSSDDNGVTFSIGYIATNGGAEQENSYIAIPYHIYGIRRGSGSAKNDIENLTADYVVEEGTSDTGWYYRKWNSGKAELSYTHVTTGVYAIDTAYGAVYYNPDALKFTLPFALVDWEEKSQVFVVPIGSGVDTASKSQMISSTQMSFLWQNPKAYTVPAGAKILVKIEGRWK